MNKVERGRCFNNQNTPPFTGFATETQLVNADINKKRSDTVYIHTSEVKHSIDDNNNILFYRYIVMRFLLFFALAIAKHVKPRIFCYLYSRSITILI